MNFKLIILLLMMIFPSIILAKNRTALIIANSEYKHVSKLKNTILGANELSKRLKKLGFTILRPIRKDSDVQFDLTLKELLIIQTSLQNIAKDTEMIFLYYAGHGASLGNKKPYIIPIDVEKPSQSKTSLDLLERQSYSLDALLNGINNSKALTIAVFDACRDIPELEKTRSMFTNPSGNVAAWHGLYPIRKQKKNRIIAYSGAEGQLVADCDDKYSSYTKRLLESLENESHLEVVNLFRSVATKVDSFTKQFPVVDMQGVPPDTYYFIKNKKTDDLTRWIEKIDNLIKESENKKIIDCIKLKEVITKSQKIISNNDYSHSNNKILETKVKIAFNIHSKCSNKVYRSNCKCKK